MIDFEIRKLYTFLKNELDQTFRIHGNDFECKVLKCALLSALRVWEMWIYIITLSYTTHLFHYSTPYRYYAYVQMFFLISIQAPVTATYSSVHFLEI
jgi:hypothetical protein